MFDAEQLVSEGLKRAVTGPERQSQKGPSGAVGDGSGGVPNGGGKIEPETCTNFKVGYLEAKIDKITPGTCTQIKSEHLSHPSYYFTGELGVSWCTNFNGGVLAGVQGGSLLYKTRLNHSWDVHKN